MARYEHLPIYKAALDLTVHFEKVVAGFSRYHKYTPTPTRPARDNAPRQSTRRFPSSPALPEGEGSRRHPFSGRGTEGEGC